MSTSRSRKPSERAIIYVHNKPTMMGNSVAGLEDSVPFLATKLETFLYPAT
jgi:hypothetical protein